MGKKTSRIYTDAELAAIERRLAGDMSDPTGIFNGRVVPKTLELLDLVNNNREILEMICGDKLEKRS